MGRIIFLQMVTVVNNNKFYKMVENGSNFDVTYGREGAANPAKESYPIGLWDKKYKEKVKKGYKDVTAYKTVEVPVTTKTVRDSAGVLISKDAEVITLVQYLQNASNNLTQENYKVEAKSVTQIQVDDAQKSLDVLFGMTKEFGTSNWNLDAFNKELLHLFTIIPRKMKYVPDHLINANNSKKQIEEKLEKEQDLLDSMASQVVSNSVVNNETEEEIANEKTLVESLGLEMSIVTDPKILAEVKVLAQEHAHKVNRVFKVVNKKAQSKFDKVISEAKNKNTKLLWHGSRTANWMNLLQKSLLIRPSGAVHNGSMFGDCIYHAVEADKSMGYTDGGRWTGNNRANYVFMSINEVHLGNSKIIHRHDSSCYSLTKEKINKEGFDSVWAKKGQSLYRDEIMVYAPEQVTMKYLVEFKN